MANASRRPGVLFKDKHIARMELLAYDEAVDGKIPKSEFEQLFTQIRDTIGIYSRQGKPRNICQ